ncbi:MAG: transglycosylase SLT domain-containing protein [Candidatus Nanopelagicales bacterium]|nr:transglycosylase SLT domain-containing protein [Candidatus Nanopelagicales bacterium]MDZ4250515.1 transglycosylase SLT domain-containing protein [Candidatus Nanopelagicales bacterium]
MLTPRARITAASVALVIPLTGIVAGQVAAAPAQPAAVVATGATPAKFSKSRIPVGSRQAVVSVSTGPSRWIQANWRPARLRGVRLRHPNRHRFYPRVERWGNLVLGVMREHKIKQKFLPGILAQIQQESGGNPNNVNNWDINAQRGYPSKGLMQVIAPTYRSNAKPGYKRLKFQIVPYTNVWAALRYVKRRYGMHKFVAWNRGHNQAY